MAFAAVYFVFSTIIGHLESPRISVTSFTREILDRTRNEFWLLCTLNQSWCSEVVGASNEEIIIIEEAHNLQDAIESTVSSQLLEQSKSHSPTFSINLDNLEPHVENFVGMAKKMKGRIEELWKQKVDQLIDQHIMEIFGLQNNDEEEDVSASSATDMVGLDHEFHLCRDGILAASVRHYTPSFYATVFCITGMGGVGKTTFAKRFYNDPMVMAYFKYRAFVRVGRGYWRERVIRSIHAQLNHGDEKLIKEGDSLEDILESLHDTFRESSCLIVYDDLWDYDILEYIHILGGSIFTRSMILVTSRLEPDDSCFKSFKVRFMNEDESWELLRRKVFGEGEVCPPLLVESGKKIAKRCGGLPLLINALAPILLEKAERDLESWKRVAEKPNSVLEEASLQLSEVLLPSYHELDETYKLYFLYITVFPESYDVLCSTINNLLYAEGFRHFILDVLSRRKSLVVEALLRNNVVQADKGKNWTSDEIKSCSLHCTYWYLNKRVARDNRFLYIMNSYADGMDVHVKTHQRLVIQTNVLLAIKEVLHNITSISIVCSLLCTGPYNQYQVPICFEWKMLRVLDVVTLRFYEFPVEVVKLVLLRYLALTCNANLPPSISNLWNLEFLIVRQHWRIQRVGVESFVPVEIWDLQELIHLEIMGRNMPVPPHPGVILPNLTHLLGVGIQSSTKGVVDNIPKLRKLRVQIELAPYSELAIYGAGFVTCFYDVKSFQCMVMNPTVFRRPLSLSVPIFYYVDKLSLGGLGYPWSRMSYIAGLPNLKVLKLLSYAFRGDTWELDEGMRFISLEFLYIEDTDLVKWIVYAYGQMQMLKSLKMKNCYKLQEIPNLDCRCYIDLIDCNPLAEISAEQIYGSNSVTATYSWKEKKKSA